MRHVLITAVLGFFAIFAGASLSTAHSFAQAPAAQLPPILDPVPVALDPSGTAFLVLDMTTSLCTGAARQACAATVPAVAFGVAAARAALVPVVYTSFSSASIVPELQPQGSEAVVISSGADKFVQGTLGDALGTNPPTTLVMTGTVTNGAVLYTAFAAVARGYTVVVAVDGVSATSDFATYGTEWQLLNQPGAANPQNMPLQAKAVTLSRTDLITYK